MLTSPRPYVVIVWQATSQLDWAAVSEHLEQARAGIEGVVGQATSSVAAIDWTPVVHALNEASQMSLELASQVVDAKTHRPQPSVRATTSPHLPALCAHDMTTPAM